MFESIINYFNSFVSSELLIQQYSIWPAIIAAVGGLASAGLGLASQVSTNKKNKQASDEANQLVREQNQWEKERYFDEKAYNQELQNQLFQREDTSYQRTVDDIQKSGLSPLAINGTNDSGTVVGNATPPEFQQINPFQQNSLNFGQFADVIAQADSRRLQERALDIQEAKNLSDKEQRELDRKESARQADDKIELQTTQFNQTMDNLIKQQSTTNEKEAKKLEIEQKKLNNILEQSKLATDKQHAEQAERELRQMTGGRGSTKYIADEKEYEEAIQKWREEYAKKLQEYAEKLSKPTSESNAHNMSAGGSLTPFFSANGSSGGSDSKTWSNLDESALAELTAWLADNPMPVHW